MASMRSATGGRRDENWPDWYAAYMVAEQGGTEAADVRRQPSLSCSRTLTTQ